MTPPKVLDTPPAPKISAEELAARRVAAAAADKAAKEEAARKLRERFTGIKATEVALASTGRDPPRVTEIWLLFNGKFSN